MSLYKSKGIVLRSYKLGEADKIIVIFSSWHGKIKAVAKGIRRTKSKFGSRLEPFTYVDLLLYKGRELDIITQAEIITSFKEIRGDLDKVKHGFVMLELIDKVGQEREQSQESFSLLLNSLEVLKTANNNYTLILIMSELGLMSVIGFRPHLQGCVSCNRSILLKTNVFSLRLGGFLCADCRAEDPGSLVLSEETIRILSKMFEMPLVSWQGYDISPKVNAELLKLTERYVAYHLDRSLKSSRLLEL